MSRHEYRRFQGLAKDLTNLIHNKNNSGVILIRVIPLFSLSCIYDLHFPDAASVRPSSTNTCISSAGTMFPPVAHAM